MNTEKVMASLQEIETILDQQTKVDPTVAESFLNLLCVLRTERAREFNRQQLWCFSLMESRFQQKLLPSERR